MAIGDTFQVHCDECDLDSPLMSEYEAEKAAEAHDGAVHQDSPKATILDMCCGDATCNHPIITPPGNMCGCYHGMQS